MSFLRKLYVLAATPADLLSAQDVGVLGLLQEALMGEFRQWDLYYAYKESLLGLCSPAIAADFEENAGEEASHISLLQRYIVGMGERPTVKRHIIPELPKGSKIEDLIRLQLKFEQEAVALYGKIISQLGEDSPLK
jgi:bacterioferritin (cytochrome b1)